MFTWIAATIKALVLLFFLLLMAVNAGPSILSDGSGIHGVSKLFILNKIMKHIQLHKKLPNTLKPRKYFDLLSSTSIGGLITIMLGRLKMSTEEALQSYNKISSMVFSSENRKTFYRDGKFKATMLVKEIQNIICQAGHSNDQKLLDPDAGPNSKGNVFICSMTGINLRLGAAFLTYQGLPNQGPDCKTWEAACATTAVLIFFKAIKITSRFGPDYVDAGLGFNNPTKEVRDKAKELFRPNWHIGMLISIGTGHPGPSGF
ncbi:acyl transferase/acyl hydrolase/lysophospholipase [Armillaria luteobubalina]|uniref:Acyl transferase/acyl hydrolase/lysophospholipase n=1 Tax=Armillaria luteobubalina TaxID=153913 RepID=A0AA39PUF6_9AGAR|nr:acyl transferase/acyl hydrolase/lysophospholipase [Armillaria luteobubalina]